MTDKEYLQKVGIELKVARIRKRMTAMDVCRLTGIGDRTIGLIERGQCNSHLLIYKRIADVLGVEMKDFL